MPAINAVITAINQMLTRKLGLSIAGESKLNRPNKKNAPMMKLMMAPTPKMPNPGACISR